MSEFTPDAQRRFSWRAAFLGGAVAIAALAFFGTVLSNVWLWVLGLQGVPPQEAYGQLFDSTALAVIGAMITVLSNATGGYTAAYVASTRFVVHSAAAAAISLAFVAVTYAGSATLWMIIWNFMVPIPAAISGGYVYARMARVHR